MKIQSQFLNAASLETLTHILISGSDDYLREQSYIKVSDHLKKTGIELPHVFEIDSSSFDWQNVYSLSNNGSLFDENTIIALSSKVALKKNQHLEIEQLLKTAQDTFFIITLPKLTKSQENQSWIKFIEKSGLYIEAQPLPHYKLPQLIRQKLQEKSLHTTNEGYEFLANSYEGNLLGLEQEIEKLSLIFSSGNISVKTLSENISDQSHNNVFQCVDQAICNNIKKSQSILSQLKRDKVQPAILLWAITKELRTLINMKFSINQGNSLPTVMNEYRIWQSKKQMYQTQLQSRQINEFYSLLKQAKIIDACVKGISPFNPWQLLESILLEIALPSPTK